MRLTDKELLDVTALVLDGRCFLCQNGENRRNCVECEGTGAFSLSQETMSSVLAELCELRARPASLTAEEREVLACVRSDIAEYGLAQEDGCEPVVQRKAVALLSRLLTTTHNGGGDERG